MTSITSRTEYSMQTQKKSTLFSGQYLRNHWTLDIGVLGYVGIDLRNTLPKLGPFLLGHPVYVCVCVCVYIYIYIFFFILSGKVSKWCAVAFWRKPVFKLYYRWYIHYLKSNSGWLSAIFCLWNVSFIGPAKISNHKGTPLVLVLFFHGGDVLVKLLSVLIARCPEIFWEKLWARALRSVPLKTYYTP